MPHAERPVLTSVAGHLLLVDGESQPRAAPNASAHSHPVAAQGADQSAGQRRRAFVVDQGPPRRRPQAWAVRVALPQVAERARSDTEEAAARMDHMGSVPAAVPAHTAARGTVASERARAAVDPYSQEAASQVAHTKVAAPSPEGSCLGGHAACLEVLHSMAAHPDAGHHAVVS